MTPVSVQILISAILCAGTLPLGVSAQLVTFSGKLEEQLICDISSSSAAQWTEELDNGTSITLFVFVSGQVQSSKPLLSRYDDLSATLESNNFIMTIRTVEKNDGGIYVCSRIGLSILTVELEVEVVSNLVIVSNGTAFEESEIYSFICTAKGVRSSNQLELIWSTDDSTRVDSETSRTVNENDSSLEDLTSNYTFQLKKTDTLVRCNITGYETQQELSDTVTTEIVYLDVRYAPVCKLLFVKEEIGRSGCTITLACNCNANPAVKAGGYSYFRDNSSIDGDSGTTSRNVELGTTSEFSCSGDNIVGSGGRSTSQPFTCLSTITFPTTTFDPQTGDYGTQGSPTALIAICCVEGVVIITMMFVFCFFYALRKGSKEEDAHSLATHLYAPTDKANTAYMDLQETAQLSPSLLNVDIPFGNLNLQAPFPGKGFIKYQKAEMTLTSKMEEIVVKTPSDDAPVRLAKLQADEVQKLATLTSNVNVAQFLGRCNNVPNMLCYQFVNGIKLGEYLRENFQPSKIHQYGNTKQKRYHIPEKGSVESLPRVALQVARGMKYLTTQKFLHPGLRSEKVIIDVSGQCKLYDFVSGDNAKDIIAILWSKSVPYQWMPPEYLFLEKLSPSVDVWSFGILMWEIFSYGALPHEGKGRDDVERGLRVKENLPLPNNCPGAIWQITLNCWDQSPEKRPSFDHLSLQLSHMCNDNKEYDEIQSK